MPNPSDAAGSASPQGRTILGRYQIEKTLGQGGMGEVLLALDTRLNRRVALKRMLPVGADHASLRNTILKEARRASQINDSHIAAIYDVLEFDDQVVLVMEYVDGVTLRERMADPVSLEAFWDLATQCVEGLTAAHAHGVIHRDIKPENLMVTRGGQIKILDFGIAKRAPAQPGTTTTITDNLSESIAGTPQYMAPEAHLGAAVDERADIFALGAVFYELLTASRPFEGATYAAVVDRVLNAEPTPVSELNPAAGSGLSGVVTRMLSKNPDERIATPVELMRQLTLVRRASGVLGAREPVAVAARAGAAPARRVSTPRTRAVWVVPAVSVIGVAVAVGVGIKWRSLVAPALPKEMNVALLAPRTSGERDFTPFALGAFDLLSTRLRRHTAARDFQMASFSDGVEQKIRSAAEARKILGVNLALVPTVEQAADAYHARLDLMDAASGRRIGTRTIQVPAAQPFLFLDRTYHAAAEMLRLDARGPEVPLDRGIRGAGTLRFHLQGIGRLRAAETADDAQRAISDFETACRMEPEAAVARAGLARAQLSLYSSTSDRAWLTRAEATAREAVGLGPARPEPHRALATVLATEKNNLEASKEYARVAELDSTDDDSRLKLARLFNRLGQPEREEQVYLETIARRPHCWQPYWWLATWHFRRGNVDESIRYYREMVRRAPDYADGYASLGGALVLRGDYGPAIDSLKRSLELRPTKNAFDNLGTAYFNSGRVQEAVDAYNQSFQFGDAGYESWINLGDAYSWLQGREGDAAGAYAQAIRLGRDQILTRSKQAHSVDVMIPANMAMVFARLGQPDSARTYLGHAVSSDSTNPMVQYCAALTYWQLNEKDRAMVWLERSVHGGYPTAWLRDSPIFRQWRAFPAFRALVGEASSKPKQAASRS